MPLSESACSAIFEIVTSEIAPSTSIESKTLSLQSLVRPLVRDLLGSASSIQFTETDTGIGVAAPAEGDTFLDFVFSCCAKVNQYNVSRNPEDRLPYSITLGCAETRLSDHRPQAYESSPLLLALYRAGGLLRLAEPGHILFSELLYQKIVVRGRWAKCAMYCGRYQIGRTQELGLWLFYDRDSSIGNPSPPVDNRIEDEHGVAVAVAPCIRLKKPRLLSIERARQLAASRPKVLVLSPHPNDIPWGCAGTLMWMRDNWNAQIYLHFLTSTRAPHITGAPQYGPPSRGLGPALWAFGVLTGQDPKTLLDQVKDLSEDEAIQQVCSRIPRQGGMPHPVYIEGHMLDPMLDKPPLPPEGMFADGYVDRYHGILRDRLAWLQSQIAPDIVLTTNPKDIHQDHKATADAALTVFKFQESIWYYELPQSSRNPFYYFSPNLFVDVGTYAERKLYLLSTCFPHDIKRFHFSPEGAQALMRTRAIEAYYERQTMSGSSTSSPPHVEAFEARIYL